MTQISKKLERVQLTDTQIKLVMPERVLNQIKYLCRDIAKVEWSGILFYSMEGSIEQPDKLVLTLQDILPMHKGTTTYTEYEFDDSVVEYMMDNETMEKGWKMGHIHSHNTMAVFFSGTDWSELEDNAPNHNFYLSLIVNNFMDFCAKVCFIAESEDNRELAFYGRNENGTRYIHSSKSYQVAEQQLIVYDCDIESPITAVQVEDRFKARVEQIIKKADTPRTVTRYVAPGRSRITTHNPQVPTMGESEDWDFPGGFYQKPVVISQKEKEEEDLEDLEDETIAAFALFVINTGNPTDEFEDIEEVLEYYRPYSLSGKSLASSILDKYSQLFNRFFKNLKDKDTEDKFIEITENLIEELHGEIYLAKDRKYVADMLDPVAEGLERLITRFQEFEKE